MAFLEDKECPCNNVCHEVDTSPCDDCTEAHCSKNKK